MRIICLLLCLFWRPASSAQESLYHVGLLGADIRSQKVRALLDDWAAEDMGPAGSNPKFQGKEYFYFQLHRELVADFFDELSLMGDVFVEKADSEQKAKQEYVQIILWNLDYQSTQQAAWLRLYQRHQDPHTRRNQWVRALKKLGMQPDVRHRRFTSVLELKPEYLAFMLSEAEMAETMILFEGKNEPGPSQEGLIFYSVGKLERDAAINVKADSEHSFRFQLYPALPIEEADLDLLATDLADFASLKERTETQDQIHINLKVRARDLNKMLKQLSRYGLLRLISSKSLGSIEEELSVQVSLEKLDPIQVEILDVLEERTKQLENKYATELDLLGSLSVGSSTGLAFDLSARQWINRIGVRLHHIQSTANLASDSVSLSTFSLQYRFFIENFERSLVPTLSYKQVKTNGPTIAYIGGGLSYADSMWGPVSRVLEFIPWFRKPKTVELNLGYFPSSTASGVENPLAYTASLKGYLHQNKNLKWIGALYYHRVSFLANEYSDSVRIGRTSFDNDATSVSLGLGYYF